MYFCFFAYRLITYFTDVCVSLVCDDTLCIIIHLVLAVNDVLLDMRFYVCRNVNIFYSFLITLEEFHCEPTKISVIYDILDGLLDMCDCMLNASCKYMKWSCILFFLCCVNGFLSCLESAFAFQRTDLNDLASKCLRQFLNIDLVAVFTNDIHHVDSDYNRDTKLKELCCQVQVTLNVCTVYNV